MIVVTAASENHWAPLRNLLASLRHHEPRTPVIVYDLGLKSPVVDVPLIRFEFERFPAHVGMAARSYAWKPILITEALAEAGEPVLWLDAGDLVMGSLNGVRREIAEHGIYTPASSGCILDWTHPTTLKRMQARADLGLRANRNGAIVGLAPRRLDFARRWRELCLDEATITPPGSSRVNHRHDQAVLSVLFYQHIEHAERCETRKLDITVHNDHLTVGEAASKCGISS